MPWQRVPHTFSVRAVAVRTQGGYYGAIDGRTSVDRSHKCARPKGSSFCLRQMKALWLGSVSARRDGDGNVMKDVRTRRVRAISDCEGELHLVVLLKNRPVVHKERERSWGRIEMKRLLDLPALAHSMCGSIEICDCGGINKNQRCTNCSIVV